MTFSSDRRHSGLGPVQKSAAAGAAPGKRTLVDQLPGPVQLHAAGGGAEAAGTDQVHAAAAQGVATPSSALPHMDAIQGAFGRHDISGIQAHTGGDAAETTQAVGAQAYATGNHVVLGATDLHTVAHEAAHVVQQRGGVQLKGGVGEVGDPYERHADEVADAVVQGKSAEGLLDRHAGGDSGGAAAAGGQPAVQGYFRISETDFAARQVTGTPDARFSAQEPHPGGESYLRPDGTTNIVAKTIAAVGALRISSDGKLAIEERGGGQAKTFFIEAGLIAGANAELVKVKSHFELVQQGGSIQVPDDKAQLHTLVQVVARNVKNDSQGDDVQGSVNCDEMASQVGGWGADHNKIARLDQPAPDWINEEGHRVAAYIVEYAKSPSFLEFKRKKQTPAERASAASDYSLPSASSQTELLKALSPQREKIAKAYGHMSAEDRARVAADLGINQAAHPEVGEAFVTFSTGAKKDGVVKDRETGNKIAARWGQHWGGVVAKSGGDYITLENYDRKGEDADRGADAAGPAGETRAFFQMYGSANLQTWHDIQKATGEFPNAVSMVYGNKKAEK